VLKLILGVSQVINRDIVQNGYHGQSIGILPTTMAQEHDEESI